MIKQNHKCLLIPEDQVIVVLDTAPARGLAYSEETPPWVETYAQMAEQGYSFSLADSTLAELLAQRCRGALSADECLRVLERLRRFLNPQLPVLLGKVDVGGMLGVNEVPWDEHESRSLSLHAWELLKRCADPEVQQESTERVLQEERDDWVGLFNGWQQILDTINAEDPEDPIDVEILTTDILKQMESSQDDKWRSLVPPMSVRNHLSNRYVWRQFVRKQKSKGAYNPTSPSKRNDGIDADLYRYLVLPALIVTEDGGFFGGLADINSFQKNWFFRPQMLADEWLQGKCPNPIWP